MYNKKICQILRAKIDSSLFPDKENEKYVLAGWGFTSSIILRLDIDSMPMLTTIFTIIEVKFMSQTLLHTLGMISGWREDKDFSSASAILLVWQKKCKCIRDSVKCNSRCHKNHGCQNHDNAQIK